MLTFTASFIFMSTNRFLTTKFDLYHNPWMLLISIFVLLRKKYILYGTRTLYVFMYTATGRGVYMVICFNFIFYLLLFICLSRSYLSSSYDFVCLIFFAYGSHSSDSSRFISFFYIYKFVFCLILLHRMRKIEKNKLLKYKK